MKNERAVKFQSGIKWLGAGCGIVEGLLVAQMVQQAYDFNHSPDSSPPPPPLVWGITIVVSVPIVASIVSHWAFWYWFRRSGGILPLASRLGLSAILPIYFLDVPFLGGVAFLPVVCAVLEGALAVLCLIAILNRHSTARGFEVGNSQNSRGLHRVFADYVNDRERN